MSETRMEYHWGRLMRCYVDRPPTVDGMFRQAVARAAHAEAVVDGGIRIDYGELDARVDRVAAGLGARGGRLDRRVPGLPGNRPQGGGARRRHPPRPPLRLPPPGAPPQPQAR